MRIAAVLGTYDRRELLLRCLESVRAAGVETAVVVDGGSTDGTRALLAERGDVVLIGQRGPLTGAVRAFNLGFGYAVDAGYDAVLQMNDDAELATPEAVGRAAVAMADDPAIGAAAFRFDAWAPGDYRFDRLYGGRVYVNFGLVRASAGMEIARAQGDPTGRRWWNPLYRTYAADSEQGCWLHRLGWKVLEMEDALVRDHQPKDALRAANNDPAVRHPDSALFYRRWAAEHYLLPGGPPPIECACRGAEAWTPSTMYAIAQSGVPSPRDARCPLHDVREEAA